MNDNDDEMITNNENSTDEEKTPFLLSDDTISTTDTSTSAPAANKPLTLARSPVTPLILKILLPILCILTHVIFYYGQTLSMWKLKLSADVNVWYNATSTEAKVAFSAVGLDKNNPVSFNKHEDIQEFTYYYAIQHLWEADGLPNKTLSQFSAILLVLFSGIWPHFKLASLQLTWFCSSNPTRRTKFLRLLNTLGKWSLADVLVVCVMVGVLSLDFPVDPTTVQQGLIDDLPHLVPVIKSQISTSNLCSELLHIECLKTKAFLNKMKCQACGRLIDTAYTHPEWAQSTGKSILEGVDTSGGGMVSLRVVGMEGIYYFCIAVIFSILLSVLVDFIDDRSKCKSTPVISAAAESDDVNDVSNSNNEEENERRHAPPSTVFMDLFPSRQDQPIHSSNNELTEPLLTTDDYDNKDRKDVEIDNYDENPTTDNNNSNKTPSQYFSVVFLILTLVTLTLIIHGVYAPTMERRVNGAIPALLQEIFGTSWDTTYSLYTLGLTTNNAGGWDTLLMSTFMLFCVFGPIVRSSLLVILSTMNRCCAFSYKKNVQTLTNVEEGGATNTSTVFTTVMKRRQWIVKPSNFLATVLHFVGSFCSWEVFTVAILMVQLQMPSITNTIYENKELCSILWPHGDDNNSTSVDNNGSCFTMAFDISPLRRFLCTICLGGIMLSYLSKITVKRATSTTYTAITNKEDEKKPTIAPIANGADDDNNE